VIPSVVTTNVPSVGPSIYPTLLISDNPSVAPTPKCMSSPMERAQGIGFILFAVSGDEVFASPDSPQSQAYNWIVNLDPMMLCPDSSELIERYILAVLSFSLSSDSWPKCPSSADCDSSMFLSGSDVCEWDGIVCNSSGSVTSLRLDELGLTGTLPEEIGGLTQLTEIDMDSNGMTGPIPESVGRLSLLEILDIDNNALIGTIPGSIYGLSALRVIDLDGNALSGTVSTEIGRLTQLYFLQLDFNLFNGSIPSELGSLQGLKYLSLFGNGFTGALPGDLCSSSTSIDRTVYANCDVCTAAADECCTACLSV